MKARSTVIPLILLFAASCTKIINNEYAEFAKKAADSFLERNDDFIITYNTDRNKHKWHYEQGLMLTALYEQFLQTGDSAYIKFIKGNIDLYVDKTGTINTYKPETFKLDDIVPGRTLLILYQQTGEEKYKIAAGQLINQLENQPRTSEGGFWHKKIYPYQMWLDGLYMALPFYGAYAHFSGGLSIFNDIALQFKLMELHAIDPETGLLYHGWDEKGVQVWANPETGRSSSFWSRAMGWYMMALVDVLDILPEEHSARNDLVRQLNQIAHALVNFRDARSKTWYQVMDQGDKEGNYLESSSTAMFIYSYAKGVNMGLLDKRFLTLARESYDGFIKQFISYDDSLLTINNTCSSAGLGGKNNRDGSYKYYLSEPRRSNDCKAIGPFIMASIELEKAGKAGF